MKNTTAETILYYEKNADRYVDETINCDFTDIEKKFCKYVKPGGHILDVGCGSGRDAKYFINKGYQVTAFDGSEEISKRASRYLGMPVETALIQEYSFHEQYDGIWCCASLLHLALSEIQIFLLKAEKFLNKNGIVYVSFKYGTCQEIRNGRYYTDLTEESLEKMISKLHQLEVAEMFQSSDVLRDRKQQWLNAILKKVDNKYPTKNLE